MSVRLPTSVTSDPAVLPLRELSYLPKGSIEPHGVPDTAPRAGQLPEQVQRRVAIQHEGLVGREPPPRAHFPGQLFDHRQKKVTALAEPMPSSAAQSRNSCRPDASSAPRPYRTLSLR